MGLPPDDRMLRFIARHHLLTLATAENNIPWTASCFYVYLIPENLFAFTSAHETLHGKHMSQQPLVAANIALETNIPGKIRGIQMSGEVMLLQDELLGKAKKAYLKRFPVAILMDTVLWGLHPLMMKMTDNRMGFGKKLFWNCSTENG